MSFSPATLNNDTHSFTFNAAGSSDLNDNFVKLISCYGNEYEYNLQMVGLMTCIASE